MASLTSLVRVEKPDEILLSQYFVEMRIWLDMHKIEPVDFRLFGGPSVGFEVRFSSPDHANIFERKFGLEARLSDLSPGFVARTASQAKAALYRLPSSPEMIRRG
jgi:hypothetical protein